MKFILPVIACVLVLGGCATPSRVSEEHIPAKAIFQPGPKYPFELSRSGIEGKALVEFIVTTEGKVVEARVIEADHPLFGMAALACVKEWRFTPPRIGDRKVNDRMRVPIYFALKEEPNQALEPTSTAVTPPVDAGDRASGARGSP